jgi:hypothetical protein
VRKGRRKVEENSLMIAVLTRGVEDRRDRVVFITEVVESVKTVFFRRNSWWLFYSAAWHGIEDAGCSRICDH